MATTPVFLPGEFHGQRSLVGNSPWGRKESDTTEQLWSTQHSTVYRVSSLCKYLIHTANQSVGLLLGHCKGSWVWQKVSPLPEIVGTQSSWIMECARCGRGEGSTEAVHTPRHGSRKILLQISAPPLLRCVPWDVYFPSVNFCLFLPTKMTELVSFICKEF